MLIAWSNELVIKVSIPWLMDTCVTCAHHWRLLRLTTVRHCIYCAREIVRNKMSARFMKLFPVDITLEYVSMDICGTLTWTKSNIVHLVVILDLYRNMIQVVPVRTITVLTVARVSFEKFLLPYSPLHIWYLVEEVSSCPLYFILYMRF